MPTPAARTRSVYQLRVVLHGVSPLIWRRLLVPGDASVADVHAVLQIAFGWDGEHLHRFVIHGVEYGIGYAGGVGFRDDPHRIHLADLGLRPTERFVYDYDFTAGWRLDLRLEQILAAEDGRVYPRCTGVRRAGPAEGCGGPEGSPSTPSRTSCSTRSSARPRCFNRCSTTTSPPLPTTARSWPPCCRCWAWNASTAERSTELCPGSPRSKGGWREGHRAGRGRRRRRADRSP